MKSHWFSRYRNDSVVRSGLTRSAIRMSQSFPWLSRSIPSRCQAMDAILSMPSMGDTLLGASRGTNGAGVTASEQTTSTMRTAWYYHRNLKEDICSFLISGEFPRNLNTLSNLNNLNFEHLERRITRISLLLQKFKLYMAFDTHASKTTQFYLNSEKQYPSQ